MAALSSLRYGQETDSKRVLAVAVYVPKLATSVGKYKVRLFHLLFLLAYVCIGFQVVATIGEPYRLFLEKADREGFQVMEGSTKLRAELEHSFQDLDDPNRRTKKIGWTDWMDMDMEELAAEKKRDKEKNVLDSLPKHMRVPNKHSPAFWPSLVLGITATLHALVILLQVWSVGFNVAVNFTEVSAASVQIPEAVLELDLTQDEEVEGGGKPSSIAHRVLKIRPGWPTHARIVPEGDHHVLVPLEYWPVLGMTVEYHRRRYVYDPESEVWSKIRCRTDFELAVLPEWQGLSNVVKGQIRYGPNTFSVRQPTFGELYQKQLLNPFSVFQVFCVLLWAIDDYVLYSLFNLFMVLMFEGTVVFQRLTSLKALRGMGNPSRLVYVHRSGEWMQVDTSALLPGDIMSLFRIQPHRVQSGDASGKKRTARIEDDGGDVVPADLLLLRGSTVVNEASLTGESVPQMKEGLTDLEAGDTLSIKGKHKMNVAYAGTKMLQCLGDNGTLTGPKVSPVSPPPDGGCLCFVLRTGFSSSQGKLVRMIEGSQEKVKGHEKETGLLLLLLCFFAVLSSSYVLYHGAQDENRSKYELLLHCIMIVTSVIRPELPMQMALAVNNSLMTLMKLHVFCTEPYKVPLAGKLDSLLFDKTGTLTTDELVAVGVCTPSQLGSKTEELDLTPMAKLGAEAKLVLTGCHSLVSVDGETTGDPLELAAIKSMHWEIGDKGDAIPSAATERKPAGEVIRVEATSSKIASVQILTRHHFSSKLQRMSCVVKAGNTHFTVAKGSPEAIGRLLAKSPDQYTRLSESLSKQGYRVIALAWKRLESDAAVSAAAESRAVCEGELVFAGFIAFTCMVRKDTADVLRRLKEGGMSVAMVTGDALLTAIHVAKEVDICEPIVGAESPKGEDEKNAELKALLESKGRRGKQAKVEKKKPTKVYKPIVYLEQTEKGSLFWKSYEDSSNVEDFDASRVPQLAKEYDLATTGKCLAAAFEQDDEMRKVLEHIKVFARMTPDAKETVIECLHSVGRICLMCGDGANDVGALKQADVGVALLSGFGNVNVEKAEGEVKEKEETENGSTGGITAIMSEEHLAAIRNLPVVLLKSKIRSLGTDPDKYPELKEKEDLVQLYQIKAREVAVKRHDKKNALDRAKMTKAELAAEKRQAQKDQQQNMMARIEELSAKGDQWATLTAMKEMWAEQASEAKKKKAGMVKSKGIEGSAAALASQLEDMETSELPMVKLGDASIAAPFTSKIPSIKSCYDIVRQGRCTLVSSIQMYQIMALQCLISSYSLSVLYLDGVKYGDSQMTAMGLLGSVSFMSVSRSKPLEKLSPVRPLTSIFHPALFVSLLGQFAIHFSTMILAVYTAKQHLPPDYEVELDGIFKPGILNTVVFLVSSVQQVTVFAVNLQGRPFMTGVTENTPLLWSLIATFILTFMFASETVPGLNRYFQLVSFPDEDFRDFILMILGIDLVASFTFDRTMRFVFAPKILAASFEGSSTKELFAVLKAFGMIGCMMYVFMGNSETWDELIEMEKNLTANFTMESMTDSVGDCVGEACDAIQQMANETASSILDEF